MVSFLLGLPGSGKTYWAVDRIYNNFSTDPKAKRDKKVTFKNCYTNINEFNFDTVENVYSLDFDLLYRILTKLHELYKQKKSDDYIVRYITKVKLKDTLFVIDEAHNFFDRRDKVLVWWLSYHRHLYHEIILITQSLSLIEAKYKQFSEFFYKAKPQSLILDKRYFKYNVYCESRLSQASKSGSIKIRRKSEVFRLYKSGDSIDTSNLILKFIGIGFVILLIILSILFYFKYTRSPDDVPSLSSSVSSPKIVNNVHSTIKDSVTMDTSFNSDDLDFNDLKFISISCSLSTCDNDVLSVPPGLLSKFIEKKYITKLYEQKISSTMTVFYLQMSKDFYIFLVSAHYRSNENEENNSHISIFGKSGNSK